MKRLIVACTDEPVVELGLRKVLEGCSELELAAVCTRLEDLEDTVTKTRAHAILYALGSEMDVVTLHEIGRLAPRVPVVLWVRDLPCELAQQAIDMGALGMVSTTASPETLKECLSIVAGRKLWVEQRITSELLTAHTVSLSKRQSQIVGLLAQGLKNREIGTALGISESTVKAYLSTLLQKVGARDRFELALFGFRYLKKHKLAEIEEMNSYTMVRSAKPRRSNNRTVA
jgi:two-component system, NarL family, nitrate/nitrite response regulator NarL